MEMREKILKLQLEIMYRGIPPSRVTKTELWAADALIMHSSDFESPTWNPSCISSHNPIFYLSFPLLSLIHI